MSFVGELEVALGECTGHAFDGAASSVWKVRRTGRHEVSAQDMSEIEE